MEHRLNDGRRSVEEWITDSSSDDDLENGQLLETNESLETPKSRTKIPCCWIWMTGLNVLIFCLTLLIVFHGNKSFSDAEAIKQIQSHSPAFKTFTPNLHTTVMNGSLFNYPPSIYRSDPSPQMDAEWSRISEAGWFLLSRSDIIALNKDPSTRARASPDLLTAMNLPADSEYYYGMIDAFHQLHCLNVIRKHSYWDSYYAGPYGTWDNAHELHWTHVSHCIEMLLQNLKCNADARILSAVWMEGQPFPSPDFNIEKKCGDFEGLLDWNNRVQIPGDIAKDHMLMENAEVETLYEAPEELYLAKGVAWPVGRVRDHEVAEHKHWYSSW